MSGTLYLLPTPIGNLGDLSRRFGEILEMVDFVAAEDTRVSVKLLNHLEIKKPLVSYYEHNRASSGARIVAVSYTHLDVYKRQVSRCRCCSCRRFPTARGWF